MNYIVLDFEWNQSPHGRETSVRRLPFEIIEIGAVKLNEKGRIVDEFSALIRPVVYKKMNHMTMEMTGITDEQLKGGVRFDKAALDFILWCGDDYMFCTWGNLDLFEFQRNLKYHRLLDLLDGPVKYINLQKIFKQFYSDEPTVSALETAVGYFCIEKNGAFHRAIEDARYTAAIFTKMDKKKMLENFTVDYYQYPRAREEEINLHYDDYDKYISRGFRTKEAALKDKRVSETRCFMCRKDVGTQMDWFASKTRNYYCLIKCPEHGYTRGKIKLKRMDDDRIVAVKTFRPIGEDEAARLIEVKQEVIEKRRERRHQ